MKSGNLNFLEPSGPLQTCNGTALPFLLLSIFLVVRLHNSLYSHSTHFHTEDQIITYAYLSETLMWTRLYGVTNVDKIHCKNLVTKAKHARAVLWPLQGCGFVTALHRTRYPQWVYGHERSSVYSGGFKTQRAPFCLRSGRHLGK
jgi:hypothetical protein